MLPKWEFLKSYNCKQHFLLLTPNKWNLPCQNLLSWELFRHPSVHYQLFELRTEVIELQDSTKVSRRNFIQLTELLLADSRIFSSADLRFKKAFLQNVSLCQELWKRCDLISIFRLYKVGSATFSRVDFQRNKYFWC